MTLRLEFVVIFPMSIHPPVKNYKTKYYSGAIVNSREIRQLRIEGYFTT
jgi:hypothetical protein